VETVGSCRKLEDLQDATTMQKKHRVAKGRPYRERTGPTWGARWGRTGFEAGRYVSLRSSNKYYFFYFPTRIVRRCKIVLSKEHPKNESDGRARIGGDPEEVLLHHRTILVGIKYVSIPFNVEDII
jgi:hypothetical protein